jgi:phosphoenolpyruvate-protein phosphotransferase
MSTLILRSPLAGWALPLDEIPDAVFAQRMAGDGVGIDPTGDTLHAPCDGQIYPMPGSQHALTLRTAQGVDILLHLGIDTVALAGAGFQSLIKSGERVVSGQPLLRFDLDLIARRARSAVTPILVVSGATLRRAEVNRALAVGDVLMEIELTEATTETAAVPATNEVHGSFRASFDHGIHARPAALIVAALKPFAARVTLHAHGCEANARSTVSMMALGVQQNENIELQARGEDAQAAIEALGRLFAPAESEVPDVRGSAVPPRTSSDDSSFTAGGRSHEPLPPSLSAVIAHRGLALGRAVQMQQALPKFSENASDPRRESAALRAAIDAVRLNIEALIGAQRGEQRSILVAHAELIQDPELHERAEDWIAQGHSAAYGWHQAIAASSAALSALADPHIRERIADLRDLELQVLRVLDGQSPSAGTALPENAILLADELLPSQLIALDRARIAGICTARGGPTSHVAIIAAALGIPALVAAGERVLQISDGAELLLDAEQGSLKIAPTEGERQRVRLALSQQRERQVADLAAAASRSETRDHVPISVYANLGAASETALAVTRGAEGCGLLRSEFLFLQRQQPPDEDEQHREYQSILDALAGRVLTIRTLDIGGDKPIPYLPLPQEDNPALGLRGLRTSLAWPHLLKTQLRAILRLQPLNQVRVLLPMVTDIDDIRSVRSAMDECRRELGIDTAPRLGVMIETPASALLADQLLQEADFLSIGTNDLSQYVLAMDRGHPQLAARLDALHPAVLRLIGSVAAAAHAHDREVAVCGGLGSDPDAIPILIGLGIREVSAVPAAIPELKRIIRSLNSGACRELAQQALSLTSARAVRERAIAARIEISGG